MDTSNTSATAAQGIEVAQGESATLTVFPDPATRFQAIDTDGNPVEAGSKAHHLTQDTWLGIDWPLADVSNDELSEQETNAAIALANEGNDEGWRLPTRTEATAIIDDTRYSPAVDAAFFPGMQSDFYRTATPAAWSPASLAWFVCFGGGYCDGLHRSYSAFVRLVRSSSPRQ